MALVFDTSFGECDGDFNTLLDFDGDYDAGIGGAFFGYGVWAEDPDCDYNLNVHGGSVAVSDTVFGPNIALVTAEDDQGGPVKVQDPTDGSWICTTSGSITPCPTSGCGPTDDADDCLSDVYIGTGATCGIGGGDGGYWVFLFLVRVDVYTSYAAGSGPTGVAADMGTLPGVHWRNMAWSYPGLESLGCCERAIGMGNPPTSGTITAF